MSNQIGYGYGMKYDRLRFEKYHDIEYALSIDDETWAPIISIRYPNGEVQQVKMNAIDIVDLTDSKSSSFVEIAINKIIKQKIRKIKLDKLLGL